LGFLVSVKGYYYQLTSAANATSNNGQSSRLTAHCWIPCEVP